MQVFLYVSCEIGSIFFFNSYFHSDCFCRTFKIQQCMLLVLNFNIHSPLSFSLDTHECICAWFQSWYHITYRVRGRYTAMNSHGPSVILGWQAPLSLLLHVSSSRGAPWDTPNHSSCCLWFTGVRYTTASHDQRKIGEYDICNCLYEIKSMIFELILVIEIVIFVALYR